MNKTSKLREKYMSEWNDIQRQIEELNKKKQVVETKMSVLDDIDMLFREEDNNSQNITLNI